MLAWGIGFADDVIDLSVRWKLTGQIVLSVLAFGLLGIPKNMGSQTSLIKEIFY